jgi:FkbM family methyltransferase
MLKIIKKIISALGYKLIEKKLYKNTKNLEVLNAINTKDVLRSLYKNKLVNKIVQIGANDGLRFDELRSFIIEFDTKALLVEPIPEYFLNLKNNYKDQKNIVLENSAISVDGKQKLMFKVDSKFYELYHDHVYGLSSFEKGHLIKHGVRNKHIISEKIKTINIKDLLNKHNFFDLDLLYVDAEGYDGEIIKEFIKLLETRPILIFEYVHIDYTIFKEVIKLLDQNNYKILKCSENVVAFNKKLTMNL